MHLRFIPWHLCHFFRSRTPTDSVLPPAALPSCGEYVLVLLFNIRGGAYLIQLYFYNLQLTVEQSAFLVLLRKWVWMNLGIEPHNVHHPGSAREENQWGEALISLQRANAVSAQTVCLGFCYSSHSKAQAFKPSSYHEAALQIQSRLVTQAQKPGLPEGKSTAHPQFSFVFAQG